MFLKKEPKIELTNMVMVYNKETNEAVVQERVKYWCGATFPGGHVETGESFYDSAVREVWEETGLKIRNLESCGTIHWYNNKTGARYIVKLYRTSDYEGELIEATEEGRVFWANIDDIPNMKLSPNMEEYLKMFLGDYSELFVSWNEEDEKNGKYEFKFY